MGSARTGAVFCKGQWCPTDTQTSPCSLETDWFHKESTPLLLILYSFSFFKILPTLTTLFCLRIKRSEGDLHFVRGNNQPSTPPPELSRGFSKRCEGGAEAKQHFALCAVERPRGSPTQRFRYQMPPPPLLSRGRLPPFPLSHALPWGCVTFPLFPSGRRGRVLPNPCRRAGTRGSRVRGGAGPRLGTTGPPSGRHDGCDRVP